MDKTAPSSSLVENNIEAKSILPLVLATGIMSSDLFVVSVRF